MTPDLKHAVGVLLCLIAPLPAAAQDAAELKRLTIEELMKLDVTTVARRSEPVSGTAAAVTVVTSEDLRRSGATTIADALRLVDGVHVAQTSNTGWNLTTRGFNQGTANKLLVMVDGRTVYSPLFTGVFWNVVDYVLEDIDRIEVIRGPGATLWGANAVNGVINIITRHSRSTQGLLASLSGGAQDHGIVSLRWGGGTSAAGGPTWRVYGKFAETGEHQFANGLPSRDDRRRGQAGFRIDGGTAEATSWMVKGDAFHSADGFVTGSRGEFTEVDAQARWSRALADGEFGVSSYYRREARRQDGQLAHHVDTFDLDTQHETRVGLRHALVAGGGFRFNRDGSDGTAALRLDPESRNYGLASLFVQDEISLVPDRWFTTVGLKWEYNSFSGGAFQPGVRTRLMLPHNQMIWGAVSRANRRPSRIEDDLVTGDPATLLGSDNFLPERLLAIEGGYRAQPRREFSVDATVFRHNFKDLRSIDLPPAGTTALVLGNSFDGHSHGIELGLNLQPAEWWRTHVSYTWLDTQVAPRPGTRAFSAGASEANDPHHLFGIRTSLDLPRAFELDAAIRAIGELDMPSVPGYAALDLRLAWRATGNLELFVAGQNLLDASHPEFGPPSPTRVEIQRAVRAGITVRR